MKNNLLLSLAIILFASLSIKVQAQCTGNSFQKVFGGALNERAHAVKQTTDGGFVIVGETTSLGAGGMDIFVMKTDANGNIIWNNTYGSTSNDDGSSMSIIQTSDGGYLFAGFTFGFGAGNNYDGWVVKLFGNGGIDWEQRLVGASRETIRDIKELLNGDFILTGNSESTGAGNQDINVIWLSSNGSFINSQTYGSNNADQPTSVMEIPGTNRDVIITAHTNGFGASGTDGILMRIDNSGNPVWTKKVLNGPASEAYYATEMLSNGDFVAVGFTPSFGAGMDDILVTRFDVNGNEIWTRVYGGVGSDRASNVRQNSNGEIIVVGETNSFGAGGYDQFLISIDVNGNLNWSRTYGDIGSDRIDRWSKSMDVTTNNEIIFVGGTTSFNANGEDIYIVKTNSCGESCNSQNVIFNEVSPNINVVNIVPVQNIGGGVSATMAIVNPVLFTEESLCPTCLAASDPLYTHIMASIDYLSDVVWDNKYYIDDNVIVTVKNGAVLDITNVDVVFGECAGIVFENQAYLRANNSVFRPCNVDGSWKGILFDGTQGQSTFDNIINESTFKNAEVALFFDKGADGVVSNNLFSNCNIGVRINDNNQFNHPISGNNFVIESFYPVFKECYNFIDNNMVYGIFVNKSKLNEVSQNNFINSIQLSLPTVFGVHQERSGGIISENTFTNINTSITINKPRFPTRIENNEIEINRNISNTSSISVFSSKGVIVEINNNELENNYHTNSLNNAIYVERSSQVSVLSNQINGYDIGVNVVKCGITQTAYNVLTEIGKVGIYYNQKTKGFVKKYITCNDITMATFNGTVGILTDSYYQGLQITTNCVKDAEQSIQLLGKGRIPYVRNNYMYNYTKYGVFNDELTGNIGTAGDPGTNTFWSNDNLATDIYSNTLIQVADNFGVFNITFATVQITSNNPYHSTASCGQQVFNMPSQGNLNTSLLCDNFETIMKPIKIGNNSPFSLENNFLQTLSVEENQFTKANMVLSSVDNPTEILMNDIIANTDLSNNEINLLKYLFHYRNGDLQQARLFLNLYSPFTTVEIDYKTLSIMDLDVVGNNYQLTNSDIQMLQGLVSNKDEVSNFAVYLLKVTTSHPDYIYATYRETNVAENLEIKRVGDEDSFLSIFPNPVTNNVTIELVNNQDNSTIQLFDISGKLVTDYNVNIFAGRIELDIHNLSNGLYFITLTNPETGVSQKGKIIKN